MRRLTQKLAILEQELRETRDELAEETSGGILRHAAGATRGRRPLRRDARPACRQVFPAASRRHRKRQRGSLRRAGRARHRNDDAGARRSRHDAHASRDDRRRRRHADGVLRPRDVRAGESDVSVASASASSLSARPDLLHLHVPNTSAFWPLLFPSLRRMPWIVHWHADIPRDSHNAGLRWGYRRVPAVGTGAAAARGGDRRDIAGLSRFERSARAASRENARDSARHRRKRAAMRTMIQIYNGRRTVCACSPSDD